MPKIWIPAAVAISLPVAWIYYREANNLRWFGILHFYYVPIYVPVVFGLVWPCAVAFQLRSVPFDVWIRLRRAWVAIALFALSVFIAAFFIGPEYESFMKDRNERHTEELRRQQEPAEWSRAVEALKSRGVTAFAEPLTQIQRQVLLRYIDEN